MALNVRTRVPVLQRVSAGGERSANKHDHQESNQDRDDNVGNCKALQHA